MIPEFDCKCLHGAPKCMGCRANEAIREAVAAERQRCAEVCRRLAERQAAWLSDADCSSEDRGCYSHCIGQLRDAEARICEGKP